MIEVDGYTLGGQIRVVEGEDGSLTMTFGAESATGRSCGPCQACCRLLPVRDMPGGAKPANTRCRHQRYGKGCGIYADRPPSCQVFACRWLTDPMTEGLPRPDKAHYVIDPMHDTITMRNDATGDTQQASCIQVWVHPAFPRAWDTPEFRAYALTMATRFGLPIMLRCGDEAATLLFAPPLTADGEWAEERSQLR